MTNLGRATLRSLSLNAAGAVTKVTLQLVYVVILARLLGPAPYGLIAAAWVVATFTEWSPIVTIPSVIVAVLSALTVGVLFGVYPALQAASWDPIEALRTE